jgi:hypothetical protein
VERVRDELLAGAGLALDEDRPLRGREPLHERKGAPHGLAHPDRAPELLARAQRLAHLAGDLIEPEHGAPDADERARLDQRAHHAVAAQHGAVGAAEVAQLEAARRDPDGDVVARDRPVGQDQIVAGIGPDGGLLAGRGDLHALVGAGRDPEREAIEHDLGGPDRGRGSGRRQRHRSILPANEVGSVFAAALPRPVEG